MQSQQILKFKCSGLNKFKKKKKNYWKLSQIFVEKQNYLFIWSLNKATSKRSDRFWLAHTLQTNKEQRNEKSVFSVFVLVSSGLFHGVSSSGQPLALKISSNSPFSFWCLLKDFRTSAVNKLETKRNMCGSKANKQYILVISYFWLSFCKLCSLCFFGNKQSSTALVLILLCVYFDGINFLYS